MIRTHRFNSEWYGQPAGILSDLAFFALDSRERSRELGRYAWVELRLPLGPSIPHELIRAAGFWYADTQLPFRVGLAGVAELPKTSSVERLVVRSAEERPFRISADEMAPFEHERFASLPGVDSVRLADRYARWANELVSTSPRTCLWIEEPSGAPVGWFLSAPEGGLLRLAVAMLHRGARVSGMLLYHRALLAYSSLGYRVGFASFSVTNTPVHNIYARLGARFQRPEGEWLWVRSKEEPHE
ncbi:MAG: hypothetical protein HY791_02500 [Deltaproteobacteria bacterium]|nr:hypothetical protein [Deltaproteobacteria bacterium]